jgi:hypothetical protein
MTGRSFVALALALAATACSSDSQSIRIERQPASLGATKSDAWVEGSAVVVGQTGSFSFPQPVSIRITLIDRDAVEAETEDMPAEPKLITRSQVTVFGDGTGEVTENVTCQPTYCTAEVTLSGLGLTLLQLSAQNTDGEESDCFYYGVYEEADPAAAGDAHREAAEADQAECQRDLFD